MLKSAIVVSLKIVGHVQCLLKAQLIRRMLDILESHQDRLNLKSESKYKQI